jgi:hypothetical protein
MLDNVTKFDYMVPATSMPMIVSTDARNCTQVPNGSASVLTGFSSIRSTRNQASNVSGTSRQMSMSCCDGSRTAAAARRVVTVVRIMYLYCSTSALTTFPIGEMYIACSSSTRTPEAARDEQRGNADRIVPSPTYLHANYQQPKIATTR